MNAGELHEIAQKVQGGSTLQSEIEKISKLFHESCLDIAKQGSYEAVVIHDEELYPIHDEGVIVPLYKDRIKGREFLSSVLTGVAAIFKKEGYQFVYTIGKFEITEFGYDCKYRVEISW